MIESALLFDPTSPSLVDKVHAYQSIYEQWQSAELSLKYIDDAEWSDTLGEKEEVEEAYRAIVNNLNLASQALSLSNIEMAKDQGIITSEEAFDLVSRKQFSDDLTLDREIELEQDESFGLDL